MIFDEADLRALADRGIDEAEAKRQLEILARPPRWTRLVRPCTVGDGIRRIAVDEKEDLFAAHEQARAQGRFTKFVPASGAATRMFRDLLQESGDGPATRRFLDSLDAFPFHGELIDRIDALDEAVETLLHPEGMNYANLPKGLIAFHRYEERARTPFEEHLVEAAHYVRCESGRCRLHFTVSEEHREGFAAHFRKVGDTWAAELDATWEIDWSRQHPSTDTLAIDEEGNPFRDEQDALVFRPGGHGALIENLQALGGDLVYLKNIDNVQPDRLKDATVEWKRLLGGLLARTERRIHALLEALQDTDPDENALDEGQAFVRDTFAVDVPDVATSGVQSRRAFLFELLNRPLRVCGVVENTGEPGGGPFWVADEAGTPRPQIVETAQVDPEDEVQQEILRGSTHFNPVDLVCALRDFRGRPFDLAQFIDRDAAIVTRKSAGGRDLRALERPGLWNGAMAGWNTLFVEVPLATFTPVKTVFDLLREEHQT